MKNKDNLSNIFTNFLSRTIKIISILGMSAMLCYICVSNIRLQAINKELESRNDALEIEKNLAVSEMENLYDRLTMDYKERVKNCYNDFKKRDKTLTMWQVEIFDYDPYFEEFKEINNNKVECHGRCCLLKGYQIIDFN